MTEAITIENEEQQDQQPVVFSWENPPAAQTADRGRKASKYWSDVAEVLEKNSGHWAKVAECDSLSKASGQAARIRTGHSRAFAPRHFEAVHRQIDDTTYGVWVRHVGPPATVPEPGVNDGMDESYLS